MLSPSTTAGNAEQVDAVVEQRGGAHQEDEDRQRRRRQEGHQVVADRQRQDERHQDEEVAFPAAPETLPPAECQPGEERNGEE